MIDISGDGNNSIEINVASHNLLANINVEPVQNAIDIETNPVFGPKGDKGEHGNAATIQVGSVTTVNYNQPATVTNVGTQEAAIFNFNIPRGVPGSSSGMEPGDAIDIVDDVISVKYDNSTIKLNNKGELYVINGQEISFEQITGSPYDNEELSDVLADKQENLVSGTNIKTINNQSILGSGDIAIQASPDLDNITINLNTDNELQAVSLKNLTASITELNYTDGVTSNIQTQLNNKADSATTANIDLSNLSQTGEGRFVASSALSQVYPVITTYVNGKSGYRIWSDGYCEQWGEVTTTSAWFNVSLMKTFKDTNYNIVGSATNSSKASYTTAGTGAGCHADFMGLTVSSFQVNTADDSTYNNSVCRWKASGYLAEGQY